MHSQVMHCTERFTQYEHGFFFFQKTCNNNIHDNRIIKNKKERKHCM